MNRQVHVLLAAIAVLCLATTTSNAATIPLTESSVIGGSGSLNDDGSLWDGTADGGIFNGSNITDGSKSENENGRQYWLVNTDGAGGDPGYLVIDLGDTYDIDQIDLYNTHNRGSNNFSTKDFRIDASNSISFIDANFDMDLSGNIATILSGTLSETSGEDPISTADSFTNITPHPEQYVRYLKFNSLGGFTHADDGPPEVNYKDNQRGLNEIEVSGTQGAPVPEPSTLVLVAFGLLGFTRRRGK
ncbi:MAG: PEP-CTERM sorting domain-containing protein [Pirellulales bacterium]|nr:PEP-CTERM sorting domain-containing protein [Pirellulales bacterium]